MAQAAVALQLAASDFIELYAFHRRTGTGSTDLVINAGLSPKFSIAQLGGGGGSTTSLLLRDTFTNTNGTLITAHAPDTNNTGNSYQDISTFSTALTAGSTDIQSNAVNFNSAEQGFGIDTGTNNYKLAILFNTGSSGSTMRVPIRWVDENNHATIFLNDTILGINQWVAGASVSSTDLSISLSANTDYSLLVTVADDSVNVQLSSRTSATTQHYNIAHILTDNALSSSTICGITELSGSISVDQFAISKT